MQRIENNYHWQRLEQWKFVIDSGNVEWEKAECHALDDKALEQALHLLNENCFPFAIVCIRHKHKKTILETPLWKELFNFLNNQRGIKVGQDTVYFKNIDEKIRSNILHATIFSVWMSP